MKKYNGLRKFKENDSNPFMEELFDLKVSSRRRIIAGSKNSANKMVVDPVTGEVLGTQLVAIQEEVDNETFTKVYSAMMREMFKLSTKAIRVFSFIATISKPNKDFVLLDIEDAMAYTEYKSKKSVYEGLEELIKNEIIARTTRHYKYFINPNLFFNGSRLTLIREYVKEKKEDNVSIENNPIPRIES